MTTIERCECCNQKITKRRKRIDSTMISGLIKCFEYGMETDKTVFQMKYVKLNKVEYWVINNLVRFWLLYKNDSMIKWEYWIPKTTVSKFLKWEWSVAEYYETDPTIPEWEEWRRIMSEERITINDIPSIKKLREVFWEWLTEYINN